MAVVDVYSLLLFPFFFNLYRFFSLAVQLFRHHAWTRTSRYKFPPTSKFFSNASLLSLCNSGCFFAFSSLSSVVPLTLFSFFFFVFYVCVFGGADCGG